jgi:hypothetical protein
VPFKLNAEVNPFMLHLIMLHVIMLHVIMLNFMHYMHYVSVIMLNVIMPSVVLLLPLFCHSNERALLFFFIDQTESQRGPTITAKHSQKLSSTVTTFLHIYLFHLTH